MQDCREVINALKRYIKLKSEQDRNEGSRIIDVFHISDDFNSEILDGDNIDALYEDLETSFPQIFTAYDALRGRSGRSDLTSQLLDLCKVVSSSRTTMASKS